MKKKKAATNKVYTPIAAMRGDCAYTRPLGVISKKEKMVQSLKLIEIPEDEFFTPLKYLLQKMGFKDSIVKRKEIGSIWQTNKDIVLNLKTEKNEINLKNCKKVEIHYEGYEGEFLFQLVQPRWRVSLGDRNKIKLETTNETFDFYLLLTNKKDKNTLSKIIESCYENTIQIKEYYRGKRTFKWRKVNFENIQEIKKRYGLVEW